MSGASSGGASRAPAGAPFPLSRRTGVGAGRLDELDRIRREPEEYASHLSRTVTEAARSVGIEVDVCF